MENKYKILIICDHPLSVSGVSNQAKVLIDGLIKTNKYTIRCLGTAIKHNSMNVEKVSPDFIIKPINGFGDPPFIRQILASEQPDSVLFFTDPRFFEPWFSIEDEIHQICPIAYWHLWDDSGIQIENTDTFPEFNSAMYESTDLLNCINRPTYEGCKKRWPNKTYWAPHAYPENFYYPLEKSEQNKFRKEFLQKFGLPETSFVCLWIARNARRKRPQDLMLGWKMFMNKIKEKYGKMDAILVMHTDPVDVEGTNIPVVIDHFKIPNIFLSKDKLDFNNMRILHNVADCTLNTSSAEGFSLPTLESLMCGKLLIVSATGGLTRQVINCETGKEYGVPMYPDVRACVGSPSIPYIIEDLASHETISQSLLKVYEMSPEERESLGKEAREYAKKEFNYNKLIKTWDETLEDCILHWRERYKRYSKETL